jgi:hypothetical protein
MGAALQSVVVEKGVYAQASTYETHSVAGNILYRYQRSVSAADLVGHSYR